MIIQKTGDVFHNITITQDLHDFGCLDVLSFLLRSPILLFLFEAPSALLASGGGILERLLLKRPPVLSVLKPRFFPSNLNL